VLKKENRQVCVRLKTNGVGGIFDISKFVKPSVDEEPSVIELRDRKHA